MTAHNTPLASTPLADDGAIVAAGAQALVQDARFNKVPDIFPQATLFVGTTTLTQTTRFPDNIFDSFPQATLTGGAAPLTQQTRFDDGDTFPQASLAAASGSQALTQQVQFVDGDTFPQGAIAANPALTQNVRFDDADAFPQGIVNMVGGPISMAADRFDDPDTFFVAALSMGGAPQPLIQIARFDDSDLFFDHVLEGGLDLSIGFRSPFFSLSTTRPAGGGGDADRKKVRIKWRDTVAEAEARLLEKQRQAALTLAALEADHKMRVRIARTIALLMS